MPPNPRGCEERGLEISFTVMSHDKETLHWVGRVLSARGNCKEGSFTEATYPDA